MNSRSMQYIGGGLILALIVIAYIVLLVGSKPSEEAITQNTEPVEIIDSSFIISGANELKNKKTNGTLPIQVPDQKPQDNPFKSLE